MTAPAQVQPLPREPPAAALAVPCSVNTLDLTNNMVGGATAAALASVPLRPRARLLPAVPGLEPPGRRRGRDAGGGRGPERHAARAEPAAVQPGAAHGGRWGRARGRTAALLHLGTSSATSCRCARARRGARGGVSEHVRGTTPTPTLAPPPAALQRAVLVGPRAAPRLQPQGLRLRSGARGPRSARGCGRPRAPAPLS